MLTLQEILLICFSDTGLLPELVQVRDSKALEVQQWPHSGVAAGWAGARGCQGTSGTHLGCQAEETDVQLAEESHCR